MGSDWRPVTGEERYRSLDILRGLALFGVLMVNLTDFRMPLLGRDPYTGMANGIVKTLIRIVLEFKAITIFSFLFGVGMAIQAER